MNVPMKLDFSPPAANYQVLEPYDFLTDIEYEAKKAHHRVWIQAMFVEEGQVMKRVRMLYRNAVHRSIDARLHADYFSLHFSQGSYVTKGSSGYLRNQKLFERLRQDGVTVFLTNQPVGWQRLFPYAGRNHMKLIIIDDIAYIGGLNFGDRDFEMLDFMVKCSDQSLVTCLSSLYVQTEKNNLRDESVVIDHHSLLITDKGAIKKSPILKSGVSAIQKAQSKVRFTSQFMPDGQILHELSSAMKRNVSVELIVPELNDYNLMFRTVYHVGRWLQWLQNHQLQILFSPIIVHAKLLLIDDKTVVFGSHNMTKNSVRIGTAELAVSSTEPMLVENLSTFYDQLKTRVQLLRQTT